MTVDTHCHLTDTRFDDDRAEVIARARDAGLDFVVTIGTQNSDLDAVIALAEQYDNVFATVGIHPHSAEQATPEALARVRELAQHPRVVGIGETGLDFFYDNAPREMQRESFRKQIGIARDLDLPLVVHSRSADEDTIDLIRSEGWGKGILHCFSGGEALLDAALELGWYISFAGMITFSKWDQAELLRRVPDERILVETDSPYLSPAPERGKRNEPARVQLIAGRAAELRGIDPDALREMTTANARRVYGIDG